MNRKLENPFLVSGYVSPEYFCDREEETSRLVSAFRNGRNVTLFAPRRMGKTGLIKNAFHLMESGGEWKTVYVDVFSTQSQADFTRLFASAVIGSMDSSVDKALKAATRFFTHFRPTVSVDPVTGSQSYSFGLDAGHVEATLKESFDYLASREQQCVVAIDEFQQVATYPEKGTEALLRSFIQFMPNTRFVFAGSKRHMMSEMFSLPTRPFYNSTQSFPLGPIPPDSYFAFAVRHMKSGGIALARETFDRIYGMFDGITWYIQEVLNRLYAFRSAGPEDVSRAVAGIISESEYSFGNLVESLPPGSVRLLRAIAREGTVKGVNAGAFIAKHGLKATSSVNVSLKKLLDSGFVEKTEKGYVVEDRFFGMWLARMSE